MSRTINEDILIAYAHDMLDAAERGAVAAALRDSPALRSELAAIRQIQRDLRATLTMDAADPTASDATWSRIEQRIAGLSPTIESAPPSKPSPQFRGRLSGRRIRNQVADRTKNQPARGKTAPAQRANKHDRTSHHDKGIARAPTASKADDSGWMADQHRTEVEIERLAHTRGGIHLLGQSTARARTRVSTNQSTNTNDAPLGHDDSAWAADQHHTEIEIEQLARERGGIYLQAMEGMGDNGRFVRT